jgi:hypothetical protein
MKGRPRPRPTFPLKSPSHRMARNERGACTSFAELLWPQIYNVFMNGLTNRIALVTGASRGIGATIAVALARAGADVAVNYRERVEAARKVCAEIEGLGRRALAVQADVSVAGDVQRGGGATLQTGRWSL